MIGAFGLTEIYLYVLRYRCGYLRRGAGMTMGSFELGAIPFGAPARHYCPYATRSAGPAAKAVDWGLADWSAVVANSSEFQLVQQAVGEARLLREYILDANVYFPLLGANAGAATDVW
jgi:hypothetical protein